MSDAADPFHAPEEMMAILPSPMVTKPFGGATDEQARDLLKAEMTAALVEVMDIIRAAKEAGYFITYATAEIESRQEITRLDIVKIL